MAGDGVDTLALWHIAQPGYAEFTRRLQARLTTRRRRRTLREWFPHARSPVVAAGDDNNAGGDDNRNVVVDGDTIGDCPVGRSPAAIAYRAPFVQRLGGLSDCPKHLLMPLATFGDLRHSPHHERIVSAGAPAESVVFVVTGVVEMTCRDADWGSRHVAFVGPGETCTESTVLYLADKRSSSSSSRTATTTPPVHAHTATTLTPCLLLTVARDDFHACFRGDVAERLRRHIVTKRRWRGRGPAPTSARRPERRRRRQRPGDDDDAPRTARADDAAFAFLSPGRVVQAPSSSSPPDDDDRRAVSGGRRPGRAEALSRRPTSEVAAADDPAPIPNVLVAGWGALSTPRAAVDSDDDDDGTVVGPTTTTTTSHDFRLLKSAGMFVRI